MIQIIDLSFETPAENIAFDETLLLLAEQGNIDEPRFTREQGEALRFWESKQYFVCIGRSGNYDKEVYADICQQDNVPVIRRISAGGTVLIGPGCLNYTLVLSYERDKNLRDIHKSYNYILTKIVDALNKVTKNNVFIKPVSDIVIDNKKVSGNAQARKRNFLLHQGTLLYNFDLNKISRYLPEPVDQPEYRVKRTHKEFITNLSVDVDAAKTEIIKSFFVDKTANLVVPDKQNSLMHQLIETKYSFEQWNKEGNNNLSIDINNQVIL